MNNAALKDINWEHVVGLAAIAQTVSGCDPWIKGEITRTKDEWPYVEDFSYTCFFCGDYKPEHMSGCEYILARKMIGR